MPCRSAVAALDDRATQLAALECLGELGGPEQAAAVRELARRAPPADVLAARGPVLSAWVVGRAGTSPAKRRELGARHRRGSRRDRRARPLDGERAAHRRRTPPRSSSDSRRCRPPTPTRRPRRAGEPCSRPTPIRASTSARRRSRTSVWFAYADVALPEATAVEFTLTGGGAGSVAQRQVGLPPRRQSDRIRRPVRGRTGEGDEPRSSSGSASGGGGRVRPELPPQERHRGAREADATRARAGRQRRTRPDGLLQRGEVALPEVPPRRRPGRADRPGTHRHRRAVRPRLPRRVDPGPEPGRRARLRHAAAWN